MLSNYSHEQLTPLNSLINNAEILIQNLNNIENNFLINERSISSHQIIDRKKSSNHS